MVVIKAFKGLRPRPEHAAKVTSPPYDVLSSEEARILVANNPFSFLRVTKPEVSFPAGEKGGGDIYEVAKRNLDQLIKDGVMLHDENEAIYIYRLTWGGNSQTGFMALSSIEDYLQGRIKRHEFTRPDKELDRTRLGETLNAQPGPVFLFYPSQGNVDALLGEAVLSPSIYDFVVDDVRHEFWAATDQAFIEKTRIQFQTVTATYIADGHHRCAAAANACRNRRLQNPNFNGGESFNYFLSVIFPDNQLRILPYHRVVADLNGHDIDGLIAAIEKKFSVSISEGNEPVEPGRENLFGMYLERRWYKLTAKPDSYNRFDPVERLDVSVLSRNLLEPILGITNLRTDKRIDFVGGIRGTSELMRLVDSGMFVVAFAVPAVTLIELKEVADKGKVMPPKSTWFEPKLRSGMAVHLL